MKKTLLAISLLMLGIIVVGIACAPAAPQVTLPKEAQKLSDVVPAMGEHWANPANMPVGPIYLVYKGKVIGMEYMFTTDLMMEMTVETPAGKETFKHLPDLPIGANINHLDIEFAPQGHEGFTVPHYDIHLYFITPQEKAKIVPGG